MAGFRRCSRPMVAKSSMPSTVGERFGEEGRGRKRYAAATLVRHDANASCIAAVNSSQEELMASSSGGVFSILARAALNRGGVVYGHAYVAPTKVKCLRVDDEAALHRLRGSKYVQSEMGLIMRDVLADLCAKREVVFSGTPCQVAGLKSFLAARGASTDRLLLIDIVCHGVPSPEFFADCMDWEFCGDSLSELRFRDKSEGWGCVGTAFVSLGSPHNSMSRKRAFSPKTSYYYTRFLAGDVYRESCYRCPYAGGKRPGDITLGDFWGIDHAAAGLNPRQGISLVVANSAKGESALHAVKNASQWAERPLDEAVAGNDQLRHPTTRAAERDRILEDWKARGIAALESDYRRETAWGRRAWLAKRVVKKLLKGVIR